MSGKGIIISNLHMIVNYVRDAVLTIVANTEDITTWVSEALPGSDGTYVCKGNLFTSLEELPWKTTNKTYTLSELNNLIYETDCSGKDYYFLGNNCHDFAKELFQMCTKNL